MDGWQYFMAENAGHVTNIDINFMSSWFYTDTRVSPMQTNPCSCANKPLSPCCATCTHSHARPPPPHLNPRRSLPRCARLPPSHDSPCDCTHQLRRASDRAKTREQTPVLCARLAGAGHACTHPTVALVALCHFLRPAPVLSLSLTIGCAHFGAGGIRTGGRKEAAADAGSNPQGAAAVL